MITDNQKALLLEQYYERGVLKKEIRSYEASLWTLQDDFLTVLKWSDVEQKGRIEHPKMTLNIDGTQKFSFSIPMYYREKGQLVENPNWYNTQNGNLMTSLRKVKVIFNKDEVDVENVDWKTLFDKVYVPKGYNGNVDLYNRNIVPAQSFIDAGYTEFNDDLEEGDDGTNHYGTLYSMGLAYTLSDEVTNYTIVYTPVAANGTVYSDANMRAYLDSIVGTSDNIDVWLQNDKADRKLILGIFPTTSNNSTWGEELHEMQAEWDQIRAKIGMLNSSNNPNNIQFSEPTYDYYKKYLRSVNTFEFIITSVTETHEKDILTCEIESEGLAFQELGKIGYKISLSQANFELVYKDWYENHHSEEAPLETVDYWCNEAGIQSLALYADQVNPRAWYYDIRMNWNSFQDGNSRSPRKVYEEPYTTSWQKSNDIMIPVTEETYREKARPVEIDKSNLYNITQTIAETFEIFCRYEFIYDENYHIIGRIIVFYNNFMNEDNMFTIQYPYSASKVSRKMDSTDTTTKLFILDPDNMTVESGQSSVMNAPPNASKEDYILNFDYMYQTEAITKEQYDAIKPFEADMYDQNEILIQYQQELASYQMKKPELEGKIAVAEKSMKVADEQVKQNERKRDALGAKYGDGTDLIKITYKNPDYCMIRTDDAGNKFITTAKANTGINENTVNIYTVKNIREAAALGINKVTDFKFEHDEYNNITRIVLQNDNQLNKQTTINYNNVYSSLCSNIPATQAQHGAVNLKNRPIVSMQKIADAGYSIANDNRFGYYSLYAQVFTVPANSEPYGGCDIVYTPITVDGEVRSATEMRTYIDSVSVEAAKHDNTRNWATYDTQKMIIDVVDGGTGSSLYQGDNGIEHNALRNWEKIKYHTGQLEILGLVYINGTKNTTNLELSVNQLIYLENHPTISGGDGLRRVTATIPVNGDITQNNISDKIFDDLTQPDINLIMDSNNVTETPLTDMVPALYLTYGYNPKFYYDNIIKTWSIKSKEEKDKMCEYLIQLGPESATDSHYNLAAVYSIYANQDSNITHKDYNKATTSEKTTILTRAYEKGLNHTINTTEESIKSQLTIKQSIIKEFEHMMGPALREGYWQPEHYDDYGDKKEVEVNLQLTDNVFTTTLEENIDIIAGWDSKLFEEEDTLYYKIGVLETLEYYPCIDLTAVYNGNIPSNLDQLSVVWWSNTITNTVNWSSIKDLGVMAVGSDALIKFIRTGSGVVKPVLMLVGAKTYSAPMLERLIVSGQARIELYDSDGPSHSQVTSIGNHWLCYRSTDETHYPLSWEENPPNEQKNLWSQKYQYVADKDTVPIVYPRIKFKSLAVKTDSDNLRIQFNDVQLEMAKHFTVQTRNTEYGQNNIVPEYYVTIKPDELIDAAIFSSTSITNTNKFKVNYVMSNANTAIYLDAIKVSKENAYPKASYEVSSNILNVDFVRTLYQKLAQIVMINDTDLKFENTFGYISGLELDLDNCQNDTMEVKNYKTKFEDLFSTIVAQTEAMKQSGAGLTTALSGGIPLSDEGFNDTLISQHDILDAYLDSYFDSSQVVKDNLYKIFKEAADVLASAQKSLNSVSALTLENAGILSGFVENVAAELTSTVTRQPKRPDSFKAGDIWIRTDENDNEIGRYMAIMSSDDLEDLSSETAGFVRTHDGSLANITGAAIDIDAEAGTIDIKAATQINLKSGQDIYIAANRNVDILGNKQVNIGGTQINLCTLGERALNSDGTFTATGFTQETQGINLIAGAFRDDGNYGETSHILISPKKIKMGSADIIMRGANKIQMVTSLGTLSSTNVISLDPTNGVWIGSGNGIKLYTGNISVTQNTDGSYSISNGVGANVELLPTHLLMGVSNTNSNTTAIEMTDSYVVIAAGNANRTLNITGAASGLTGAKFTKNSIGLAVQTGAGTSNDPYVYNAIIMNKDGVSIGSTDGTVNLANTSSEYLKSYFSTATHGSYVRVAASGIELGSMADLYINTDNFKLQTHSRDKGTNNNFTDGETIMAIGNKLQSIDYDTQIVNGVLKDKDGNALPTSGNTAPNVRLLVNKNGLYVKGNVYATAFVAQTTNGYFKATGANLGFYDSSNNSILTINSNAEIIASKKLTISADQLYIGSSNFQTIDNNTTKEIFKEYARSSSNTTAPTSGWTDKIPDITNTNTTVGGHTVTTEGSNKYVWVRTRKITKDGTESIIEGPTLDNSLTNINQAKVNAMNLASGATAVPHVESTGITIDNGNLTVGATASLSIIGNHSINIYSNAQGANNGIILDSSGITIGTTANLAFASGGVLDIESTNFKVISNASGSGSRFYVGTGGTNVSDKYINYTADGTLEIRGKVVATGFELTTSAQSDFNGYVDTGMDIGIWGRQYDENGDNVADPKQYLMLKSGNNAPGGIICGGYGASPRNFIIPWIPDNPTNINSEPDNIFETPAFLINKDGLQYRYMTDDGTGRPNVQSALSINGGGISLDSGHVLVNGQQLWEGSILYSVDYPDIHPEHNWVWIKPMSNAISRTVLTTPENQERISYGDNQGAIQVFTTDPLPQIGTRTGDYQVSVWITAMVVNASNTTTPQAIKQGNINLNVGIVGGPNNDITVCTIGSSNSIYVTYASQEFKLGDMVYAYGGYSYTNHNNPLGESSSALTLTIKNMSNLYLRIIDIQVYFGVETVNSMTPCNVYYCP